MLKKDTEHVKITKTDDQVTPGRVKQICQNFLVHSDSGFAHRLQEEEFAAHFDRNRTHRRESRLGVKTARDIEEEEKRAFAAKQRNFYQEKQKLEENDSLFAQKLQKDTKNQSHSINSSTYNTFYHKSNDHSCYAEIDQVSTNDDTSSDEQLAKILQEEEEEELSLTSRYHSSFNSTIV